MELKKHLCKFCGQTDPKKFSKNHKSTCRKCATAQAKKNKEEIDNEIKLTQAAVDLIDSIQWAVSDIVDDIEKDLKKKFIAIIEDDREVYQNAAKKWDKQQVKLFITIGLLAAVVISETIYIVKPLLWN